MIQVLNLGKRSQRNGGRTTDLAYRLSQCESFLLLLDFGMKCLFVKLDGNVDEEPQSC